MARYWTVRGRLDGSGPYTDPIPQLGPVGTVYCVEVGGFTFTFASLEELREYRAWFAAKLRPTARDFIGWGALASWENQTRMSKLPAKVIRAHNRDRVIKALDAAFVYFERRKRSGERDIASDVAAKWRGKKTL